MKDMFDRDGVLNFGDPDDTQDVTNSGQEQRQGILTDVFGPPEERSIIKVIGVGGGGSNAVNHMYREGIHDVSFVVCNLDQQALNNSPVPVHLLLGNEGLGAGNNPQRGRDAAEASVDAIKKMLSDGTKMTFITAGMGGGTGTGAAPVIARVSKEMGILTVGIVTIPFRFEGRKKIYQALDGVEEMAKHVDALLVINNERLREICSNMTLMEAFDKADNTLCVAAKSIAEIITIHGYVNLDFNDVKTVMKDGGVAIMSTGYGEGESRVKNAINDALDSPLLNNNDIFNSKKILLNISFSCDKHERGGLMVEEVDYITDFTDKLSDEFETKWGIAFDSELGDKVKVTILATGFDIGRLVNTEGHVGKQSVEDIEALAEKEAEDARRAEKMRIYYGLAQKVTKHPSRPNIYLFRDEDLDNDDLISAIESTPTYKRTAGEKKEIQSRAHVGANKVEKVESDREGTIKFLD